MNDILKKIENLPANVKCFLTSFKFVELNGLICDKFKIEEEKIILCTQLITGLFLKEIAIIDLSREITARFDLNVEQAKQMALDISGMCLLIVDGWFNGEASKYIKFLGGDPAEYEHFIIDHKEALKKEEDYFREQNSPDEPYIAPVAPPEPKKKRKELDPELEVKDSIELFGNQLVAVLESQDNFFEEYNDLLIGLMLNNLPLKSQLETALLANNEKLTIKAFNISDKSAEATIANWLKDFIQQNGSDMPDALEISNFIANSKNAKILNSDEKRILRKLLTLYRNLKFFPESMGKLPPEKWEIIPIDTEMPIQSEFDTTNKDLGNRAMNLNKDNIQTLPVQGSSRKEFSDKFVTDLRVSAPLIKEEGADRVSRESSRIPFKEKINSGSGGNMPLLNKDSRLKELRDMLGQFPVGSLGRKAVEEEIEKILNS